jgi:hypothetical protein
VSNEPLGSHYAKAVERAETILLPAFDSWRTGGKTDAVQTTAAFGTLDWVFAEYRADRRFTKLDARTKRNHEVGFKIVGDHVLKDGRKLGKVRVSVIDTVVVDTLYEKLLVVRETDADGNVIERERRTTVNHAMKSCRRRFGLISHNSLINLGGGGACRSQASVPNCAAISENQSFRAFDDVNSL